MSDIKDFVIVNGVLTKYNGQDENVIIPDDVISIGDFAFDFCKSLVSIVIPDNVTNIGRYAFNGCENLVSIVIPDSVTSIGCYAFNGCEGLVSVVIPDSVTSIGDYAFGFCGALTSVVIPDSVTSMGDSVFVCCENLSSVTIPRNITDLGMNVFKFCKGIADENGFVIIRDVLYGYYGTDSYVAVPENVKRIGAYAFNGHSYLESVTIPDNVTSIGECAFNGCKRLTSINIPKNISSIGESVFKGCKRLTDITLPADVNGFEDTLLELVWECFSKTECRIAMMLAVLRQYPENETVIKKIKASRKMIISDSIKNDNAEQMSILFSLLGKVKLEVLNEYIEQSSSAAAVKAFLIDYKSLNYSVETEEKYETQKFEKELGIRKRTVADWKKIFQFEKYGDGIIINRYIGGENAIEIPAQIGKSKVVAIGNHFVSYNNNITYVSVPDSVTSIGASAFSGCKKLKSIIIPDSVTDINNLAFSNCESLADTNGFVIIRDSLYGYYGNDTDVVIPDSVTKICPFAFNKCEKIVSVTIPGSITNICDLAFVGCENLRSISIPDSVAYIGDSAFEGCRGLADENGFIIVRGILHGYCGTESDIVIPDGVTGIGSDAFSCYDKRLLVTVPDSVTYIALFALSRYRNNIEVRCSSGSYAETYAMKNNIPFVTE